MDYKIVILVIIFSFLLLSGCTNIYKNNDPSLIIYIKNKTKVYENISMSVLNCNDYEIYNISLSLYPDDFLNLGEITKIKGVYTVFVETDNNRSAIDYKYLFSSVEKGERIPPLKPPSFLESGPLRPECRR